MKNGELLPVLTDFLQCSAFLPSTLEFSCFWTTVLERLQAPAPDGWGEPAMHDYLLKYLLSKNGDVLTATWRSGFGTVPLGFSTYAPNAVERTWRLLKGLLKPGSGM